jgi:putative colanic acid biosynthesis UDP-glucose lipid carrier transferase
MRYRGLLKEYGSLWETVLRGTDAAAAGATALIAAWLYVGPLHDRAESYSIGMLIAVLLVLIVFPAFGVYRTWRGGSIALELREVTLAWTSVLATLAVLAFLAKRGTDFSRAWFLIWFGLGWAALAAERIMLRSVLRVLRSHGFNTRRIVVVRVAEFGIELAKGIEAAPWTGLKVKALFCAKPHACNADRARSAAAIPEFVRLDGLAEYVERECIDQVLIALPLKEEETIREVLRLLRHSTVDVSYVPDMSGLRLLNSSLSEIAGFPVMSLSSTRMQGINELVKNFVDKVLALVILVLVSPLMFAIALGIKLTSRGPVFFRQRRLGAGGEEISVLKFRSMVVHAEEVGRISQARRGDERVTPFGSFLRRTSLDELPQFFNVLSGDMSIVGPRPHAIEHNEHYKELVQKYMLRHKVKPGITGWAQVNGYRGETDTLEKMAKRVEYDLHYIENWSLWLDLKIMALTVVRGFSDRNAY